MPTSSVRRRLVGAACAALTVPLVTVAAPATASPPDRGSFVDTIDDVVPDFCDVPGLTVHLTGTFRGVFLVKKQGSGHLVHFAEHDDLDQTISVVGSNVSFRVKESVLSKDLKVTDNGDGTLSIIVLATGPSTLYGPNGKALARNPGQVRYEILVDDNGTPSFPDDDEFLAYVGAVKDSTGRNDDYCAAMVGYLGLG
ncbi:MAG: hypothetical protein ABIQ59_01550 [Nocardioidaceae bacterium]